MNINAAKGWLKGDAFGMPKWVWIALLSGGVVVGLYLRSHRQQEEVYEEEEEPVVAEPHEQTLAGLDGSEQAGGLAAAGLVGPPNGSVVPVNTPFLPEGLPEIILGGQETQAELGNQLGALATAALEQEPNVIEREVIEREPYQVTGGGPPRKPKKKPVQKPKPKQKQKQGQRKPGKKAPGRKPPRAKKPPRQRQPKQPKRPPKQRQPAKPRGGGGGGGGGGRGKKRR